ncbi:MAG: hypothetical protein A3F46_07910 [Legionellales bacterium RIFCSPHIGHO2_12_FULL_42_9]|nr:MAG: hypothetical protein A3F46_07910 [Legionellales bacterium RIFCSPHIGHO2_12_FULL_42_9]
MKIKQFCTALCLTLGLAISVTGYAQTLEIINHFDKKLNFSVTQGGQFTPNFPTTFSIEEGQSVTSPVLKSGRECLTTPESNPSTYISVKDDLNKAIAFFATGLVCENDNLVEVSGFMDTGMAYSWKNGESATLVFCKASDYPCLA